MEQVKEQGAGVPGKKYAALRWKHAWLSGLRAVII